MNKYFKKKKNNKPQDDIVVLATFGKKMNAKSENISKDGRNRLGKCISKKIEKLHENTTKEKELEMAKLRKSAKRIEDYIVFLEKINKENITRLNEEMKLEKQKEKELMHEREFLKKLKEILNMNDEDKEELNGRNNANVIISINEGDEEADERIDNKSRSEIKRRTTKIFH